MRRLKPLWMAAFGLSAVLAVAIPCASAAVQTAAVSDCLSHGELTAVYSTAQLQTALNTMSATTKEYSGCYDVIQRQLFAQAGSKGGNGSSPGSGGSFLPTPVIVVLVLLALGAVTFGAIAIRRRSQGAPGGSPGGREDRPPDEPT